MPDAPEPRRKSRSRQAYRSRHRAASHASAHDEAHHAPAHAPIDHPLVPPGAAEVITDDDALDELIGHLRTMKQFSYDSEFIGELSYHPQLCLIQVATAQRVALIDPLAGLGLRGFWELLADPAVEKVVHAGEQDIEPVARLIGKPCTNIFDTQIAAGFIGLAYPVALSKLVNAITGARLGKGLTFTHWDQRPLSAIQLRYAADDVRYLLAVRDAIGQKLEALKHAHWAKAECEALCDPARYAFDPDKDFLRIRGAGTLSAAQMAVLRELVIWREQAALAADAPPRSFLRDEILIDMARHPPKALEKLARVRGLPRPVEHEHGQEIVELTLRALANPLKNVPQHPPEPTPAERFRADAVWALAQVICLGQSMDPNIVASRQDVAELDRLLSRGSDLAGHRLLRGWRREALGEPLLRILHSQSGLKLHWSDGALRAEAN